MFDGIDAFSFCLHCVHGLVISVTSRDVKLSQKIQVHTLEAIHSQFRWLYARKLSSIRLMLMLGTKTQPCRMFSCVHTSRDVRSNSAVPRNSWLVPLLCQPRDAGDQVVTESKMIALIHLCALTCASAGQNVVIRTSFLTCLSQAIDQLGSLSQLRVKIHIYPPRLDARVCDAISPSLPRIDQKFFLFCASFIPTVIRGGPSRQMSFCFSLSRSLYPTVIHALWYVPGCKSPSTKLTLAHTSYQVPLDHWTKAVNL